MVVREKLPRQGSVGPSAEFQALRFSGFAEFRREGPAESLHPRSPGMDQGAVNVEEHEANAWKIHSSNYQVEF
jgi:hypothetical protein